ncbi:MAG: hypothetical protein WC933_01890 [Candidatus Paceibacterota bacterium]|jgi:hypothetical protein
MSIKDLFQKIKSYLANFKDQIYSQEKGLKIKDDLYIILMIMLVGTASFGLGKISSFEKNKTPISVLKTKEYMYASVLSADSPNIKNDTQNPSNNTSGMLVASKSGTKYYYPWCTGVSRIKEENKVWFNSVEEARAKGLTSASNCTGLK